MSNFDRNKIIKYFALLSLIPTIAMANAGSPMMWFGILHCLFLNAIIGIVESLILKRFNIPNRLWLIIIANYVSMFVGLVYIAPHFSTISGNLDFWGGRTTYGEYGLTGFFAGMLASFFATLILELPFFYLAVKDKMQRKKIFIPFLAANTITNAIMFILYFLIASKGEIW